MTEQLSKISDFLEELEAMTEDKSTAKAIRIFMKEQGLWKIPTPPQENPPVETPEVTQQIVYNAVKCHECNETIVSYHTHDYKTCGCENEAMVDGGLSYARYGAKDMSKITKITYTDQDPHDLIRHFVLWGTYGKNGDEALKYVYVCDMSDEHIRAILGFKKGALWMKQILKNELDYRSEFNISITD